MYFIPKSINDITVTIIPITLITSIIVPPFSTIASTLDKLFGLNAFVFNTLAIFMPLSISSYAKDGILLKVKNTTIKKTICMEYGKNTVCINYKVQNGMDYATMTFAPIINFRDFHSMSTNWSFNVKQNINKTKVKIILNSNSQTPIYMNLSEGKYIEHKQDTFKNMFYIEEQKRGFEPEENHCVPGRYEVKIAPNEYKEITFVCSFEDNIDEINADTIINQEKEE